MPLVWLKAVCGPDDDGPPGITVSAREIERLTGFRFFGNVPEEVAEALRDHRDEVEVPIRERKRRKGAGD
jgi:hypothetical protein